MGIVRSAIEIAATPAVVYALVADVTRTGEWSPECVSGRWVDDFGTMLSKRMTDSTTRPAAAI